MSHPTRFRRHFITGELEEVPYENPNGGRTVFRYGTAHDLTPTKGIPCIRSDKPHISKNAAIHVEQVEQFNKVCASGTHYDAATGCLVSTSDKAREREARRRGLSFA